MTNIHIGLITYALDVTALLEGLDPHGDITWHIHEHSARADVNSAVDRLRERHNLRLGEWHVNRGLARSWNDCLVDMQMMKADVMIIINDDATASRADLDVLVDAALKHRECGIIEVVGYDGAMARRQKMNYGFTAINPIALNTVGYFDEAFVPLYFEDCDYSRRCSLLGVTFYDAGETGVVHAAHATIQAVPALRAQNAVTFAANAAYYARKHGGSAGAEVYSVPFNDAALSWKIDAEHRANPYPQHERHDLEGLIAL